MIIKLKLVVLFSLITTNLCASERKAAIGFGLQYGGAFGWQGSILEGRHRASVGVGLPGASIGYDYKLSKRTSIGVSTFAIVGLPSSFWGAGVRMQYYPQGTFVNGWAFGIDIYRSLGSSSALGSIGVEEENFTSGLFSIGYGYK